MRVLRLGLGEGRTVDLHPAVSVVVGLSGAERTALRQGFTAIATGLDPRADGLVEAHGLLLDASQDDLDLLEVRATAAPAVVTTADLPGAGPADEVEALRRAERDLLQVAGEGWRARGPSTGPSAARPVVAAPDPARAAELRTRIARHEARDAEAVRVALDDLRDATRSGATPDADRLAAALATVGLDATDLGLPADHLVRLAEDWLDERRRESDWVVGAVVELAALEAAPTRPAGDGGRGGHSQDAASAHAEAVARTDQVRSRLVAAHAPSLGVAELEAHLVARLAAHHPARLAGAVPLVLDGVLAHLDDQDVARVLDRIAGLAGAVQLVVADEHPAARAWAEGVGVRRAAVVTPVADPVAAASR